MFTLFSTVLTNGPKMSHFNIHIKNNFFNPGSNILNFRKESKIFFRKYEKKFEKADDMPFNF